MFFNRLLFLILGVMIKYIVNKKDENKNIVRILSSNCNVDKNAIYKALRKKDVKINGKRVSENITLNQGDVIEAYIFITNENTTKYSAVFENEYVIIFNKMQGVPVVDDSNNEKSLVKLINEEYKSVYEPCHRIDRNTGGLIIFSKNRNYTDLIKEAINNRFYKKIYNCIVWGNAENLIGVHKAWHFKDGEKNRVYIYDVKKKYSKEIITEVTKAVYNPANNTTSLEINLITGRTHQIRAHLAHIGHPIIGDGKYGVNSVNKDFGFKFQQLKAYELKFDFKTDSGILNYLNNKTIKGA